MIEAFKMLNNDAIGLHPLYVDTEETIPTGIWLKAKPGKTDNGKVISRLGPLSYRPGWHLSAAPFAPHIGIKVNGKIRYMHDNAVWALCKVYDEIDYTPEAHANGVHRNGKFVARDACLKRIPAGGFYWYNTNPNAYGDWLIAELMMVERILSDKEVAKICWEQFGIIAMPHRPGKEFVA